jgi:pyrroloquinoline quinone biosynthesis protein E
MNKPLDAPLAVLLELTHRCPLRCAYCSNPTALLPARAELSTADWQQAIREAAALGMLQVHFSGGEPMARADLDSLIRTAHDAGLYTNLITSGLMIKPDRLARLKQAGLDHIQLSFQDLDEADAEWVSGYAGGVAAKKQAAEWIRAAGFPLTLNFVMTRRNTQRLQAMLDYALRMGVTRCEIANVQYYGWGLANRAALLPTREQLEAMTALVQDYRERYRGELVIDYVVPDYYARRPKACMGGWAQRFINLMPDGVMLPCHAAQTIEHLEFPRFPATSLHDAWFHSAAFAAYRGTDWMPEPCSSCERKEIDYGGCRCQALALAGSAATVDPVCERSPLHQYLVNTAFLESTADSPPPLRLRGHHS